MKKRYFCFLFLKLINLEKGDKFENCSHITFVWNLCVFICLKVSQLDDDIIYDLKDCIFSNGIIFLQLVWNSYYIWKLRKNYVDSLAK